MKLTMSIVQIGLYVDGVHYFQIWFGIREISKYCNAILVVYL
jgi:hypothetical protein